MKSLLTGGNVSATDELLGGKMSISVSRTSTATVLSNVPRDIREIERQAPRPSGFAALLARVFGAKHN